MPVEPERYNIDEMMDRLKNRSEPGHSEEGELVQRADGTMAVRVKRRKRRSAQPHKERQHRWRVIQVVAVLVLLLVLLLGSGFFVIYANSSPFRKRLAAQIEAGTSARAQLQEFRMNPLSANASAVDLSWPRGGVFEGLTLNHVSASTAPWAMISGHMSGRDLTARSARLVLSVDCPQSVWLATAPRPPGNPIAFERYGIRSLDLQMLCKGELQLRLDGAEAVLEPPSKGRMAQWRMSGGHVDIRGWAIYDLDRALLEFHGPDVRIVSLRLSRPADVHGGVIEISGVLNAEKSRQPSQLDVSARAMPLSGFVGDGLGSLLVGRVDCEPKPGQQQSLKVSLGPEAACELDVRCAGTFGNKFELQRLPCLFALSQALGDEWYGQPDFEDRISCRVRRRGARVEVDQLELGDQQRMVVRGSLAEEAGQLQGRLMIGLLPTAISATQNRALDAMFGPLSEGRRWVELTLSGPATSPTDDFSQLYDRALKSLPAQPQSQGTGFEQLTRPR